MLVTECELNSNMKEVQEYWNNLSKKEFDKLVFLNKDVHDIEDFLKNYDKKLRPQGRGALISYLSKK
jgi:16S rRNA C1402 N4-methylase RsmH